MTILNETKRRMALILGSQSQELPSYFAIGSGSGATVATMTTLIAEVDRQVPTSIDTSTVYQIKFTGDWNSVELSGIQLKEYGIQTSGATLTGSMWSRTSIPSITFNGTNELRIEEGWTIF